MRLVNDRYGRFIWRNCRMDDFKRRRGDWIDHEQGMMRKKSIFKDLLGEAIFEMRSMVRIRSSASLARFYRLHSLATCLFRTDHLRLSRSPDLLISVSLDSPMP